MLLGKEGLYDLRNMLRAVTRAEARCGMRGSVVGFRGSALPDKWPPSTSIEYHLEGKTRPRAFCQALLPLGNSTFLSRSLE